MAETMAVTALFKQLWTIDSLVIMGRKFSSGGFSNQKNPGQEFINHLNTPCWNPPPLNPPPPKKKTYPEPIDTEQICNYKLKMACAISHKPAQHNISKLENSFRQKHISSTDEV